MKRLYWAIAVCGGGLVVAALLVWFAWPILLPRGYVRVDGFAELSQIRSGKIECGICQGRGWSGGEAYLIEQGEAERVIPPTSLYEGKTAYTFFFVFEGPKGDRVNFTVKVWGELIPIGQFYENPLVDWECSWREPCPLLPHPTK